MYSAECTLLSLVYNHNKSYGYNAFRPNVAASICLYLFVLIQYYQPSLYNAEGKGEKNDGSLSEKL